MSQLDYASPNKPYRGSAIKLLLAWLIVIVPAAWGVSKTVQNSLHLFEKAAPAPAVAPAPATAPAAQR